MFNSTSCDILEYLNVKSDYVSCIKVGGQPILPPLMTPERCLEMQKYKQLAIEVEKKLKSKRQADKCTETNSSDSYNDENFYSDESTHIENCENTPCENYTFQSVASQTTLDHIPEKQNSVFNRDKNFLNSSELVNSGHSFIFKPLIQENDVCSEHPEIISPKRLSTDMIHQGTGDSISDAKPPRLIRTNSYILETPSPLLVSFLENQRANVKSAPPKSANVECIRKYSNENRRRSCWDLASAKEKWTSFENNINFAFIPSKINTKNVKSKFNRTKSASLPASNSPSPTNVEPKINNIRRNSLTNDSKKCRKSIFYSRSNSLEMRPSSEKKSCTPALEYPRNDDLLTDSIALSQKSQPRIDNDNVLLIESKIKDIYQTLQEEHSKKMAELMIRQKKEQELLITHFKQQQLLFIEQIRNNCLNISNDENSFRLNSNNSSPNCGQQLPTVDNYLMVPESGSESEDMSSQTIHYHHENTSMMTTPDPDYCLNVENMIHDNCYQDHGVGVGQDDVNKIVRRMINSHRHEPQSQRNIYIQNNIPVRFHINNYTNISNYESCDIENVVRCTTQPHSKVRQSSNSIEICAVIKIQAAVRGYLVRRLLRTERVQSLIQTLKDTLICALEFHTENIDNIEPADVELHKRLIQQLTAACFAIHDTFFKLTTKEKMAIIASDRQRIKEKILRPPSAKSSPTLSATTQKTIQRKLLRSNISTPSFDENQTPRKSCEHSRIGSALSGNSTTSVMSLTRDNNSSNSNTTINSNMRVRGSSNNFITKKPWR